MRQELDTPFDTTSENTGPTRGISKLHQIDVVPRHPRIDSDIGDAWMSYMYR
jgi:hypothetical protein